jgi:predicted helicase
MKFNYRPFDNIYIYYDKELLGRPFYNVMQHFIKGENIALLLPRQAITGLFGFFSTNQICDINFTGVAGQYGAGLVFPLYTYPETPRIKKLSAEKKIEIQANYQCELKSLKKLETCFKGFEKLYKSIVDNEEAQSIYQTQKNNYLKQKSVVDKLKALLDADNSPNETLSIFEEVQEERQPNFNREIIQKIADNLGLKFTHEKETKPNTFAPIDLLDYIYAVLHSPTYRETYKEFLKIDFPRVPYPEIENFWQLVELGSELRQLHLLESPKLDQLITCYPMDGLNCITRKVNKNTFELTDSENQLGQIWINDRQYFDQVPLVAWNFYVGGYQPVQKWLKDRQGRVLSFEDILHYQKIIKSLTETARIMQAIDFIYI